MRTADGTERMMVVATAAPGEVVETADGWEVGE